MQKPKIAVILFFILILFILIFITAEVIVENQKANQIKIIDTGVMMWQVEKCDSKECSAFAVDITEDKENYLFTITPKDGKIWDEKTWAELEKYTQEITVSDSYLGTAKEPIKSENLKTTTTGTEKDTEVSSFVVTLPKDTKYFQIGTQSLILVNQEIKAVLFSPDEINNITATLYKNVSGEFTNAIEDLFVYYNSDEWKFGANDTSNTGLEMYKYIIESTIEPIPYLNGFIYGKSEKDLIKGFYLDLSDICNKVNASCVINQNSNTIEVIFYSDSLIDPTYSLINNELKALLTNITWEPNNITHLTIDNSLAPYDSLVAYWSFDGDDAPISNTSYDFSSNNNDGTYTGGVSTNKSCNNGYGYCASFDGVNDYISLASPVSAVNLASNYSVSMWIKPANLVTTGTLFHNVLSSSNFTAIMIYNAGIRAGMYNGTGYQFKASSSNLADTNWHHIVTTYNGSTLSMYLDNVLQTGTNPLTAATTVGARIGAWTNGLPFFNGSIDEFMIFNTSLNSTQISDIYNNQSVRFKAQGTETLLQQTLNSSGFNKVNLTLNTSTNLNTKIQARLGLWDKSLGYNTTNSLSQGLVGYWAGDGNANDTLGANNGTLVNQANAIGVGVYNQSFRFDGDDDGINISDNSIFSFTDGAGNDKPFSISFWTYPRANPISNDGWLVSKRINSNTEWQLIQYLGNLTFQVGSPSFSEYIGTRVGPSPLNANSWYHIVATYNGSETNLSLKLYVNGAESQNAYVSAGSYVGMSDTIAPVIIGYAGFNPTLDYYGDMDEVMIFNRSLNSSEIKELYVKGLANWNYTAYQDFNSTISTQQYTTSTKTSNILLDTLFIANSTSEYSFYTPILFNTTFLFFAPPNATLLTPITGTLTNNVTQNLTANLSSGYTLKNASVYINEVLNQTITFVGEVFQATVGFVVNLAEGVHTWFVKVFDVSGSAFTSGSNTITIDLTKPWINILYPLSTYYTSVSQINFTVYDVNLDSCWFQNSTGNTTISCTDGTTICGVIGTSEQCDLYSSYGCTNYFSGYCTGDTIDDCDSLWDISSCQENDYCYWYVNEYCSPYGEEGECYNQYTYIDCENYGGGGVCYWTDNSNCEYSYYPSCSGASTSSQCNSWGNQGGNCAWFEGCYGNFDIFKSYTALGSEGNQEWCIGANDTAGNVNTTCANFTVDFYNPNSTLIFPANNTYNSTTTQNFTANLTDNIGIKNATLYIYNQSGFFNSTFFNFVEGTTQTIVGTAQNLTDGVYRWFVEAFDWAGNSFTTGNNTLTIDTIYPLITINSPIPNQDYNNFVLSIAISPTYTATDINLQSCWYELNGSSVINKTIVSCSSGVNTFTFNLNNSGSFTLFMYVNDSVGHENSTSVNFTVSDYPGQRGGGSPFLSTTTFGYNMSILCNESRNFLLIHNYNGMTVYTNEEFQQFKNNLAILMGFGMDEFFLKDVLKNINQTCKDYFPQEYALASELECDLDMGNKFFEWKIPNPEVNIGDISCPKLNILKWLFAYKKVGATEYAFVGFKVWYLIILSPLILAVIIYRTKKRNSNKTHDVLSEIALSLKSLAPKE
jgi:hypothetical protein